MLKSHRTFASLIKGVSATAVVLGFGLGLSACSSDDKVAGGGPSGTEAGNAITAQILTADNTPAKSARVRLTPNKALDSDQAYTATTDENGMVSIPDVSKGDYILEARLGGTALQQRVTATGESQDLGASNLGEMASVSGSLGDSSDGTLKVRGLDHSAPVVNGKFVLDSLPAGHLDLVFVPEADQDTVSSYVKLDAGEKVSANTFANEKKSLLLDDFQDRNNQHRFGPMYFGPSDGGWWYISHAQNVEVLAGLDSKDHVKLETEDGNTAIHVTMDFESLDSLSYNEDGERVIWPWGNMGVEIGSNDKDICYDLTSVDSVAFKAKGNGNFRFMLVDETHKTETFDGKFAESNQTLSEDWQRFSIALDDIIDERAGSLTCVTLLSWDLVGSIDMWLDDIELIGGEKQLIWEK